MHENDRSYVTEERHDPLLECLVWLTHYYQRPYSADALCAGLPIVDELFTPSLFVRAAETIGLKARVFKRDFRRISKLVLPVVLLLKNQEACILQTINADQTVNLIFPETSNQSIRKTLLEVESQYSGYVIFVQETYQFTASQDELVNSDHKSSWFWDTLLHHRFAYGKVMLAAFLINIFALLGPLYIMNVYDRVVSNQAIVTLWVLSIGILIIYLFDFLLRFLRAYVIDVIGKKSDILMAGDLFQKVLTLQLTQKPHSVGYFVSNLREFEVLRDFFTSATLTTIIDFPFIFLYLLLMGYIGEYIVLVPIVSIIILIFITLLFNHPLQELVKQVVNKSSQRHAVLVETVSGLEIIKSMVAESIMQRKWEHFVGEGAKISLKARFASSFITNFSMFIQQLLTVGIVIVGVYEIINGHLSLGGLIACSILGGRIMAPIGQMIGLLSRYSQAKTALKGLNDLMALPSERTAQQKFLQLPKLKGEIEFKNVSFQYPEQETKALDNVSFKIAAGEHVAILGRVGSGKSTINKLILGLYHAKTGTVYLDGVDILQLDPIDVRRNIGYVPQETMLFSGSIRENILMGRPRADDAAIIQAAKLSAADNFIKQHPLGYQWVIGERGEGLSGGQRQTIAITRALLSNAPILLLDEPTSSLDDSSELELIQNLQTYIQNKTLILITHRIQLLKLVTRIIVMANNKIALDGPRDEVLKKLQTPNPSKETKPT